MERPTRLPLLLPLVLAALAVPVPAQERAFFWADYDGDGRQDAFVVSPGLEGRLLRSLEGGTLQDVTASAGLDGASGVRFAAWGDYDGDGRADLFLGTQAGPSKLYRALEGGLFEEVAQAAGLVHEGADLHAAFVDYDADGRPDLYVHAQEGAWLYHNEGEGHFALVPLELFGVSPPTPDGPGTASGRSPAVTGGAPQSERPSESPETPRASTGPRPVSPPGTRTPVAVPPSSVEELAAFPACARAIADRDGGCLFASSTPTLGQLYPISADLYVDAASGWVGLGTTNPSVRLDVAGDAAVDSLDVSGSLDATDVTVTGDVDLHGPSTLNLHDDAGTTRATLYTNNGGGSGLVVYSPLGLWSSWLYDWGFGGGMQFNDAAQKPGVVIEGASMARGGGWVSVHSDTTAYSTVGLFGEGPAGGGQIEVNDHLGRTAAQLNGDFLESGELLLYDQSGFNNSPTVSLRGRDLFGTGAEILMTNILDVNVFDVDGGTTVPELTLREHDGSNALRFLQSNLYLYDSSGVVTITYNRESGTKSAVVETSTGRRRLFAMESPEVWFEDFGQGRLVAGRARVDLDPLFLETVTIDSEHPLSVFVTPTAPLPSFWVEQALDHFVVHDPGGVSNATFNWRAVAKRRGTEELRLPVLADDASEDEGAARGTLAHRPADRPRTVR